MLSVYDGGQKYPVTNATDFYITHVDGGLDTLDFTVTTDDPIYTHLAEENRVEYGDNDYNIKSIDAPGTSANISCEINLDFLRKNFHHAYDSGSVTLPALLGTILPDGWTIAGYDPGISRTISMDNATDYDIVNQIMSTYAVAFQWQTLKRVVTVVNPASKTPSGEYLTDELNLRSIAFKGESTDFCTRLYPYGKDGLTIAGVNGGKEYVENHQYSNKVICGYWSDDRYTVPENLKADAIERLAALSAPARSYDCDVVDLAKLDGRYADFAFSMYKVVTLIDRRRGLRLDHQIMEYKEYPDEPEKNVLTLSSVVPTVQDNIGQAQQAADDAQASANEANNGVAQAKTEISQLNGEITLKADKDKLISLINISPESIKISSNKIEITGEVVLKSDLEDGDTTIDGACIRTGRIESQSGDYSLDMETGEVDMRRGTFSGSVRWGDDTFVRESNGHLLLDGHDGVQITAPNGSVNIFADNGQIALSAPRVGGIGKLFVDEIQVGNDADFQGYISVDGDNGKTEMIPVTGSDGSTMHLHFKNGIYVSRD